MQSQHEQTMSSKTILSTCQPKTTCNEAPDDAIGHAHQVDANGLFHCYTPYLVAEAPLTPLTPIINARSLLTTRFIRSGTFYVRIPQGTVRAVRCRLRTRRPRAVPLLLQADPGFWSPLRTCRRVQLLHTMVISLDLLGRPRTSRALTRWADHHRAIARIIC
jgi:hypothetical protein